jgi:hypothetical protein
LEILLSRRKVNSFSHFVVLLINKVKLRKGFEAFRRYVPEKSLAFDMDDDSIGPLIEQEVLLSALGR